MNEDWNMKNVETESETRIAAKRLRLQRAFTLSNCIMIVKGMLTNAIRTLKLAESIDLVSVVTTTQHLRF